jgi:hypothetical protein
MRPVIQDKSRFARFGLWFQDSSDGDSSAGDAAAAAGYGGGEGVTSSVGIGNNTSVNTTNQGNVSVATGAANTGFGVSDAGNVGAPSATGGGGGTAAGGAGTAGAGSGPGGMGTGSAGMGVTAQQVAAALGPAGLAALAAIRSGVGNALFGGPANAATPYNVNEPNPYLPKPFNPNDPNSYGALLYGPGVTPYNRGGVTNIGSGLGFGLGIGGQGNAAANQSQTVQGIRAGLSNTVQNALNAPHNGVTAQDVENSLSPAAYATLQAELANIRSGMGYPALGYNTAAATAAHFGNPAMGPNAPVGTPTAETMGAGGVTSPGYGAPSGDPGARGSSAVGTATAAPGIGVVGYPGIAASNVGVVGAPPGYGVPAPSYISAPAPSAFSQALSQNVADNVARTYGTSFGSVASGMGRH